MKQLFKKVFSLQSSVFKLVLLLTVICGLWTVTYAQNDIYATAGRTKILQWKSAGDYTAYDSLLFVAVKSSVSDTNNVHIIVVCCAVYVAVNFF